ncbi:hypothetical protein BUALT_Bualt08G0036300 [Buddleja alternifolia]|uniref:Sialate O-acetylesterase domain-containing protein n=1 Tax=Buddleja alternifolia TaxID=168488 RepID=A0AAV6XE86_9LAMI|nr:hypothetical protein BUALT_Bualt08G0036300 [Buddleja alternifolia]
MKHSYNIKILVFLLFLILLWDYLNSGIIIKQKLFPQVLEDDNDDKKISIFILAGQSNMVGRGGVINKVWDKFVPPECSSDPRIIRVNENSELEIAKEPLHAGLDHPSKTCGVGPGMAFANAILKKVPNFGTIILVPSAFGGSSVSEWASSNSSLREKMINRTNQAVRYGGKIRGLLWYQGETDTQSEWNMRNFPGEYHKFIHILYKELLHPRVPFIQVALASGQGKSDLLERVRAAQLGMEDIITVDAMGLAVKSDGFHLTTMAQVHLGNMLADAFLKSYI